ncbi:MAG: LysR family transcriptional regulator [Neisseriaceae bacterium]|nr:LysR family transcriptional regulator [Neisseriaceae bacterium]MBP6862670.1 LysR family transcriptional regulator [Neisseriaceae bacterium]
MDLNQIKSFIAVANHGNLTQAAETLHLSQPAVTAQIKAMEKKLDVALFLRTAQGMVPTPAGEAFLPKAEQLLNQVYQVELFAKRLSEDYVKQVKIGMIHPTPSLNIGQLVHFLLQALPTLDVQLSIDISGAVLNQVRKKELDAGFYLGKNPYRNVHSMVLSEFRYVLICPVAWHDTLLAMGEAGLAHYPWIKFSQFLSLGKLMIEFYRLHNFSPKHVTTCDHISAAIDLVAAEIGLALVRADEALEAQDKGLVKVLPAYFMTEQLSFIYPEGQEENEMLTLLKDGVRSIWRDAVAEDAVL